MGIAEAPRRYLHLRPGHQLGHLALHLLQHLQLDLPPPEGAQEADVGEGPDVDDDTVDEFGDFVHLRFAHAALGDPGRADADAAGLGGVGVAGDGVLVGDDARQIEDAGRDLALEGEAVPLEGVEVNDQEVGVRPAVGQLQAAPLEPLGQGYTVLHDLMLQALVLLRLGDLEGHGDGGELVDVGPALLAGEDGGINQLGQGGVGGQDDRSPWAEDGLVGGESGDVSDAHRVGIGPGDGHARRVGDVGHEEGPAGVGDLAELLPIRRPGVGGVAGDDDLGPVLQR